MGWSIWLYDQILCFLFAFFLLFGVHCSAQLCPPEHSSALLQFKAMFSVSSEARRCNDGSDFHITKNYPKTESWNQSTDCCSWKGVTCNSVTGRVIGLDLSYSWLQGTLPTNSTFFLLQDLQWLDLACNDFIGSQISPRFGNLVSLTHLNLSMTDLTGLIPSEISQLSKLVSLDLSGNFHLKFDDQYFNKLVQNLTKLENLFLDKVNMLSVGLSSFQNMTHSLKHLHLSDCGLKGKFSSEVFRLSNIEHIDLRYNTLLVGYLPKSNWSTPLRFLDLSDTGFSEELPNSIGNLRLLEELHLVLCHFTGSIPPSLGNLTQLTVLDLFLSNFGGQIPDVFGNLIKLTTLSFEKNNFSDQLPPSIFNLTQLVHLGLSSNRLEGELPLNVSGLSYLQTLSLSSNHLGGRVPSWLFTLPSLQDLDMANNKLSGPIDHIQTPNSIQTAVLSNNEIHGQLPSSFFDLVNLTDLDVSSNNLSGTIESNKLSKLKNVWRLDLSNNRLLSLSSNGGDVNYTFPELRFLFFSSCNAWRFPNFLRTCRNLNHLDLSNNNIHGPISRWESEGWEQLDFLDLSHNFLTSIEQYPGKNIGVLDLRSNLLQGQLLSPPVSVQHFLMSKNKLSGLISPMLCNLSSLITLDLSRNDFHGIIPECLGNTSMSLSLIDIRMNNIHGKIPDSFPKTCSLSSLYLNDNQLEGLLPQSLINCEELEVLDLGNNQLNDTFPQGFGVLASLKVLILRSNRLHGPIQNSGAVVSFPDLRVIDLSHNEFTGPLPTMLFKNLIATRNLHNEEAGLVYVGSWSYYQDSVIVTMKGLQVELVKILTIFTAIDFSNNQFKGHIPEELGEHNSLIVLNFSHNRLTGHIPSSFGNLAELESLDLSSNMLDGRIPLQLTNLTFLAVLNLSQNNLVGDIPRGNQFDTFTNDSYSGNSGLCGSPLSKKCDNDEEPGPSPSSLDEADNSAIAFSWEFAIAGYGCGLVFGLSLGYIVFVTRKPKWFIRLIERDQYRKIRRHKRQRAQGRRN